MTKQEKIRKVLYVMILPLFIIPVSAFMLFEFVLDGTSFAESWKKYLGRGE